MSTATVADNAPIDPDDELLVAYLDGELDRQEQSALENRLVDEPTLRARLQQLQAGWDLLEELPQPTASTKLVESTLELAVADIVKSDDSSKSPWRRWRIPAVIVVFSLIGVGAALAIAQAQKSQRFEQQLEDLAIAEHLDAFTHGGDLTLMRQLQSNPDWINVKAAAQEIGDIKIEPIADLASIPTDERPQRVAELPLDKKEQLTSRWERFNRLDPSTLERIRRNAAAVAEQPDSELLIETMQAYELWRQVLPPELRDRIESSDPKVRREAINEAIAKTQVSISQRSRMKLNDETIDSIYFALQYILRRRIDQLHDEATIDTYERAKDFVDPEHFTIYRIVGGWGFGGRGPSWRRPRPPRPEPQGGGPPEGGGPPRPGDEDRPRLRELDADELEIIAAVLPPKAQDMLDFIAGNDQFLRTMTLRNWAEETARRKSPIRRPDNSTLAERYEQMDPASRELIDLLPPREILTELSPEARRPWPPLPRGSRGDGPPRSSATTNP